MDSAEKREEFEILALYKFEKVPRAKIEKIKSLLTRSALDHKIRGLLILAEEGCNMTIAGPGCNSRYHLDKFIDTLSGLIDISGASVKYSKSYKAPYPRFKVVVRDEIVTLYSRLQLDSVPIDQHDSSHITPDEWDQLMASNCQIIDTRNDYEVQLGTFKGALNPKISKFTQFVDYIETAEIDKSKPTLIFCTGGIRCEKAYGLMKNKGFKEVYQLDGGILNYLRERQGAGNFEGECFVFDHRVAVDNLLNPTTKYKLSRINGDPVPIDEDSGV